MDYKGKIRRLLALAESPNENEAKAALLKARELMAEHKLTQQECVDTGKIKVLHKNTEWTFSKRRDPWLIDLATTIGEHYCCEAYTKVKFKKQTNTIWFIGFEDDIEICMEIFDYAAKFVTARTRETRSDLKGYLPANAIRIESDSYGYGFIDGLEVLYDAQQNEEGNAEWGLVLKVPKEVHDETIDFRNVDFTPSTYEFIGGHSYNDGYDDGLNFDAERMLKENRESNLMLDDDSMRHPVTIKLTDYSKKRK